ncbi:LytR C-terminal domain-containing protein [Rhodohalobacter halophilus]|uniref:LytR C-terminal domain-containing protein n=1 Tax=Rhodohalobacter halophilus TaxID=1812810 RepID=UPI00083F81D5|nr:LytR C-terminal domain-containing protein [Rhodohalobacter halophilus]
MSQDKQSDQTGNLILNSVIGFLSVLLIILLFALGSRLLYPRIASERAVEDPTLISTVIQMEVLNGVGISGLANQFTGTLRQFGFDVVETGNYDHFDVPNTLIISRSGQIENARRVARAIGVEDQYILREEAPEFYLDVTLVIGSDYEQLNL